MSNRVDEELSRVMSAMSESAPPWPDFATAHEPNRKTARRSSRSLTVAVASVAVILGIVGLIAVVNGQGSSPSIVVAMNNPDEVAVVGTFPHLLIEGWALTDVSEDFGSVEYRYERSDAQVAIRIEFGDQDDLNAAIADTVAGLSDPYNVDITGDEEQQVVILDEVGASSLTAVWGNSGRVFKMDTSGIGSSGGVRSVIAKLSVATDAQWAEAQAGLAQP